MCFLFTCMREPKYIPVLFMHLHQPNFTHKKRGFRQVEDCIGKLAKYTGSHLQAIRGYEQGVNSHEHVIVLCAEDELERFWSRYATWKSWKAWSWTHLIEKFDESQKGKAYEYVLQKHQPVMPSESKEYFCPRKYHRCKKGRCTHIPTPHCGNQYRAVVA